MFTYFPCFPTAGNTYALSLCGTLLLFLCATLARAQSPTFSFELLPEIPESGDTASIDVSLADAWSPGERGDSLIIVYACSGFRIHPESPLQLEGLSEWLQNEAWTVDFELNAAGQELRIRLSFAETPTPVEPGWIFRLGGVEVVIDEYILRSGQAPLTSSGQSAPRISWQNDAIILYTEAEDPLREILFLSWDGRMLGRWMGEAQKIRYALPPQTESGVIVSVRTHHQQQIYRLRRP